MNLSAYLATIKLDGRVFVENTADNLGRNSHVQEYDAGSFAKGKLRSYDYLGNNQLKQVRDGGQTTDYLYNDDGTLQQSVASEAGRGTVTTQYSYAYWDTARQSRIEITGAGSRGASTFEYDANGHVSKVVDNAVTGIGKKRVMTYVKNAQGQVLHREDFTEGGQLLRYRDFFFADGRQIGDLSNDGPSREDYVQAQASQKAREADKDTRNRQPVAAVDFDQNYEPISASYPGNAASFYTAQAGDSLRAIAQAVWGDGAMWYLIAEANGYDADVSLRCGEVIEVPNKVANIHHSAGTVCVYNHEEIYKCQYLFNM